MTRPTGWLAAPAAVAALAVVSTLGACQGHVDERGSRTRADSAAADAGESDASLDEAQADAPGDAADGLADGEGVACRSSSECPGGVCSDGACCDRICVGLCESCRLAGSVGLCRPKPLGAICGGAVTGCSGEGLRSPSVCDANSLCVPRTIGCGAYTCRAGACLATCEKSEDCATGYRCAGVACVLGRRFGGESCKDSSVCLSGRCVLPAGVCCDVACGEACSACDVPGKLGTCTGAAKGTLTGSCGNYICNGARGCPTSCSTDADCFTGSRCVDGRCGKSLGASCYLPDQCLSGFCVNSVCCDRACKGGCSACDLVDSPGTCKPVPAPSFRAVCGYYRCAGGETCPTTCAADADCAASTKCIGGHCGRVDGDVCYMDYAGRECASGFCANGFCCDSACKSQCSSCALPGKEGQCLPRPKGAAGTACGAYRCGGGAECPTSCASDADCMPGRFCEAGVCGLRNGEYCTAGKECLSNHCTRTLCCNEACTGACQDCARPDSRGTCQLVTDGPNPPTCFGESTCDAAGACVKP